MMAIKVVVFVLVVAFVLFATYVSGMITRLLEYLYKLAVLSGSFEKTTNARFDSNEELLEALARWGEAHIHTHQQSKEPTMKTVYIAHPLGSGTDRDTNRAKAAVYVARAAELGWAPIATWIVLSGLWSEERRELGMAVDLANIEVCDEVWLCGHRVSESMQIEARHALLKGKRVCRVLGTGDAVLEYQLIRDIPHLERFLEEQRERELSMV
jgi:hypothetical protein